jgi:hypothetical protein
VKKPDARFRKNSKGSLKGEARLKLKNATAKRQTIHV